MKSFKLFIGSVIAIVCLVVSGGVFTSCTNDDDLFLADNSETEEFSSYEQDSLKAITRGMAAMTYGMEIVGGSPFTDHPLHGIPNDGLVSNASVYKFWVSNPASDVIGVKVIFTIPSGGTVTTDMTLNSSGNYVLQQTLSQGGRYGIKYLIRRTGYDQNVTPYGGYIYNTRVDFSGTIKKLVWPFGADNSGWSNRTVYVNGTWQTWCGGEEDGGPGYGWNEGTHTGNQEQYSDDWNRGSGSQDLGAEVRSPLDGYVEAVSTYPVSGYGNSKYVSITQVAPNGTTYRFYVAHLNTQNVSVGQYVKAGITKIGTIGSTGASSPHAHCNLRINGSSGNSVKFYFNAIP
jgi:hypothetical protein